MYLRQHNYAYIYIFTYIKACKRLRVCGTFDWMQIFSMRFIASIFIITLHIVQMHECPPCTHKHMHMLLRMLSSACICPFLGWHWCKHCRQLLQMPCSTITITKFSKTAACDSIKSAASHKPYATHAHTLYHWGQKECCE